jgi:hypothetical protein
MDDPLTDPLDFTNDLFVFQTVAAVCYAESAW